jgi:hypothetical protein
VRYEVTTVLWPKLYEPDYSRCIAALIWPDTEGNHRFVERFRAAPRGASPRWSGCGSSSDW